MHTKSAVWCCLVVALTQNFEKKIKWHAFHMQKIDWACDCCKSNMLDLLNELSSAHCTSCFISACGNCH